MKQLSPKTVYRHSATCSCAYTLIAELLRHQGVPFFEQPGPHECSVHSSLGGMPFGRASCQASFNAQCLDPVNMLR